jgi:hypothetical protein
MHTQSSSEESKEFDRLDGAILGLLVEPDHQRPWAEHEIARAITLPGDVQAGLDRLHSSGLIHRWNGMVSASYPSVRFEDSTQTDESPADFEREHENTVLEVLLSNVPHQIPMSRDEIERALGAEDQDHRIAIYDAVARLDLAGLVDRKDELVFVTPAAVRFDQIMDL